LVIEKAGTIQLQITNHKLQITGVSDDRLAPNRIGGKRNHDAGLRRRVDRGQGNAAGEFVICNL
jgi:hypothetical protein